MSSSSPSSSHLPAQLKRNIDQLLRGLSQRGGVAVEQFGHAYVERFRHPLEPTDLGYQSYADLLADLAREGVCILREGRVTVTAAKDLGEDGDKKNGSWPPHPEAAAAQRRRLEANRRMGNWVMEGGRYVRKPEQPEEAEAEANRRRRAEDEQQVRRAAEAFEKMRLQTTKTVQTKRTTMAATKVEPSSFPAPDLKSALSLECAGAFEPILLRRPNSDGDNKANSDGDSDADGANSPASFLTNRDHYVPALLPGLRVGWFLDGVRVTNAQDPGQFHVHLKLLGMLEELAELEKQMKELYDGTSNVGIVDGAENENALPKSMQPMALKHWDEQEQKYEWHRVLVIRTIGLHQYVVNHVDYGFTTTVGREHLRHLHQKFASLPTQAVECRLSGLSSQGHNCSMTVFRKFPYLIKGCRDGLLSVVAAERHEDDDNTEPLSLILIDVKSNDLRRGLCINDELVAAKCAKPDQREMDVNKAILRRFKKQLEQKAVDLRRALHEKSLLLG